MNKVKITFTDWDYTCGDKCCYEYGTTISVNGVECENQYSGDDPMQTISFVLEQLGIEYEIEHCSDYEEK